MSNFEERMKAYRARLQQVEAEEKDKQVLYQQKLNQIYADRSSKNTAALLDSKEFDQSIQALIQSQEFNVFAKVDLSSKNRIKDLDQELITFFNLDQYLNVDLITYPTIYCETLDEFFTPIFNMYSVSPLIREKSVEREVQKAVENAEKGGVYGVNLPGTGCYINGWLIAQPHGISALEALEHPELLNKTLITAVHEKLGHGFLDVFSSLGQVSAQLGSYQSRLAQQFGMQLVTDPVDKVRRKQYKILHSNFIFLHEGWATWLESFFGTKIFGHGSHPKYSMERLNKAVDELIPSDAVDGDGIEALKMALMLILGDELHPPDHILAAIHFLHQFDRMLDDYFSRKCGQPLRYILGELIMSKISLSSGLRCVPFAALIAANISFDPERISLTDMRELFHTEPQLNPDARLVMLSKLKLEEADNVMELAFQAENILSMQVPHYLKA
jgi:hypothetical protein